MPAPAVVAIIVVPAVAWSAWTHTAVPAIAVVVGAWAAVVDASMMRSTRTIAWAIVAAVVAAMSTARTVIVVAWAIVTAVVATVTAARTMVAIAWVHIAATMVSAMISTVVAARVHIATRSVVASTRTSVAIAIISTGAVVAVAGSDGAWFLDAASVNL